MKKKLLAGTVLSICLLSSGLSACSSEDKTEKPSSENQLQSDYMEVDGILTKTEKGSFSVHDGLMYFTDYETQTSIHRYAESRTAAIYQYMKMKRRHAMQFVLLRICFRIKRNYIGSRV